MEIDQIINLILILACLEISNYSLARYAWWSLTAKYSMHQIKLISNGSNFNYMIIKIFKYLSNLINYIIKYCSYCFAFKRFIINIKYIKYISCFLSSAREIISQSKLYKIYILYNKSIKLLSIINIIILLYYSNFQLYFEFDYITFIAIISTIYNILPFNKEIGNLFLKLKKIFYIFNEDFDSDSQISNHLVAPLENIEDKKESVIDDSSKKVSLEISSDIPSNNPDSSSYNKGKIICITIIGIGICAYIYWDIYTQGIIYSTVYSIYNNFISSNDDGNDTASSSDYSSDSSSSSEVSNAPSYSSSTTLVSFTDLVQSNTIVENNIRFMFWDYNVEIPAGSRIILSEQNNLIYSTPDNRFINFSRAIFPDGGIFTTRHEVNI